MTLTLIALFIVLIGWNLFLHLKLRRESNLRRELALAFRQATIERRRPALNPALQSMV